MLQYMLYISLYYICYIYISYIIYYILYIILYLASGIVYLISYLLYKGVGVNAFLCKSYVFTQNMFKAAGNKQNQSKSMKLASTNKNT